MSVWEPRSQNAGQIKMLILHDDGNLVLYDGCGKTIWESETSGKCFQGLDELIYLKNAVSFIFNNLLKEIFQSVDKIRFLFQML